MGWGDGELPNGEALPELKVQVYTLQKGRNFTS